MSDGKDTDGGQDQAKGRLSLRPAGRLELGRTVDAGSVKQSFSHGRTKNVQVEIRKTRPASSSSTTLVTSAGARAFTTKVADCADQGMMSIFSP
jgi:translation initiation factor IF-2